MQKSFKWVLYGMAIMVLLFARINVFASNQGCEIQNANIEIYLQANGDAVVEETWKLKYIDGEFNEFYREISSRHLSLVEKYDKLKVDEEFYINGEKCTKYGDLPYHYSISYPKGLTRLSWLYKVEDELVEYKCSYTIEGIVKKTDEDKALFAYNIISSKLTQTIESLNVSIFLPQDGNIEVEYSPTSDYVVYDDHIEFVEDKCKGKQEYYISTSLDNFDAYGLKYISQATLKKECLTIFLLKFFALSFVLILIICLFVLKIRDMARQSKFKKRIKEDFYFVIDEINSLKTDNIHPLQLQKKRKIPPLNFILVILLDLARREEAYFTNNEIIINKEIANMQPFETDMVRLLLDNITNRETYTYYAVDLDGFYSLIKNYKFYSRFARDVNKIKKAYYKENPYSDNFKGVVDDIKRYFKDIKFETNIYSYILLVMQSGTIDYTLEVALLLNSKTSKEKLREGFEDMDLESIDDFCNIVSKANKRLNI